MIYLDAASTAKYNNKDDIIVDTITQAMRDSWMNPSSLYAPNVKNKINKCRENLANFIGAKPDEIYYTSGGSESNCMAIQGFVKQCKYDDVEPIIITSTIEHKSIMNCIKSLDSLIGMANVFVIGVDEYGFVKMDKLEHMLKEFLSRETRVLVSIQFANNEIGTLQPIQNIAKLVHKYGGIFHTDSVQAFGHIPIDVEELGIDMMSCSGHKISPVLKGIGFLYKKNGIDIKPLIYGTQESGLRGGTENTFGIIGLDKAIEYCDISSNKIKKLSGKRNYFIMALESKFGCKLNGHNEDRLPNNVNVIFPQNIAGESMLYMLDMSDIKISTGSACNSKSITPSHVLKAIGLTDKEAMKSIRITLPSDITYEEIDKVVEEISKVIKIVNS